MRSFPIMEQSYLVIVLLCLLLTIGRDDSLHVGQAQLMYEWSALELKGIPEAVRGTFQKDKNILAGIKVYKQEVYLTIPRWRYLTGIPATLAKVVQVEGRAELHPYPDLRSQTVGDCKALQYVQSMEIDPNTGRMYVIDTGRIGIGSDSVTPRDVCPAKLVVFDLNTNAQLALWEFPENVVSRHSNFINDLVLDYVMGEVKYAYITDVATNQIHVFDFSTNASWSVSNPYSMKADTNSGSVIHIDGNDYIFNAGVNGIAMSPHFDFVYYCPLSSYNLYSIPTSSLRQGTETGIRLVGRKISQSGGLSFSNKRLYYGALGLNAVFSWNPTEDMRKQGVDITTVTLETERKLIGNDSTMQWPDSLAIDNDGWLWFVSNRLHRFTSDTMDFSGSEINMRVWRVFINESSYLSNAPYRSKGFNVVG